MSVAPRGESIVKGARGLPLILWLPANCRELIRVITCNSSGGPRGAAHGGNAAVVAVGQFLQRSALRAPSGGLFLLRRGERRGTAHALSMGLGSASPLGCAGAD